MRALQFIKLGLGATIVGTVLAAASTAAWSQDKPSEYVVGHLGALTGTSAPEDYGIALRNATELAIEEINAAGGVGGVPLRGVYEDHQAMAQAAVQAMQKLVNVDSVPVVLGNNTNVVLAVAPIATNNHVLVLNCCARASSLTKGGDYVFTSRPYDREEEQLFMKYLSEKKGFKKVAMINNASESGRSSRKILESMLPTLGMELVDVEEYPEGTVDFSSYIAKIRASQPDVVYMNTFGSDVGSLLLQMRQTGLSSPVASYGSALDPNVLTTAGPAAEGLLVSSQVNWNPKQYPVQQSFIEKYQAKYGGTPAGFAALQYDLVKDILPKLIRYTQDNKLAYTGDNLREALLHIKKFEGELTGDCEFTPDRECAKDMAIFSVVNGAFEVIDVASKSGSAQ